MNPLSECSLASLSHISTPLPHSTNLMLVFLNWHTLGRVIGSQTYVSFLQISEIGSSLRELHWSVTVSWSEVVVYKICLDTSSGSKSHIYFVLGCFKIVWFQWNLSEEKAHLVVMVCLYGCWSFFHESHICTSPKTSTLPYCFSYCTLRPFFPSWFLNHLVTCPFGRKCAYPSESCTRMNLVGLCRYGPCHISRKCSHDELFLLKRDMKTYQPLCRYCDFVSLI